LRNGVIHLRYLFFFHREPQVAYLIHRIGQLGLGIHEGQFDVTVTDIADFELLIRQQMFNPSMCSLERSFDETFSAVCSQWLEGNSFTFIGL
jgi:hypothetical protein